MIDLTAAADQVRALARTVTSEQLDDPTPCDGWTVRDLLGHLVGLTHAFTDAARKQTDTDTPEGEPRDLIDDDGAWQQQLDTQLDELVQAWNQPEAWRGETEAGGITMAADEMGVVALDELVLHGWNLAASTGQPFSVEDDHLDAVNGFVAAMSDPDQADQRNGLFGTIHDVPDAASNLERVLAISGRDPNWTR